MSISPLKPSRVNAPSLDGLGKALLAARRRWQRQDRETMRATFHELRKQRMYIIRQEDLYSPNSPFRLGFQCQRAAVDLHIAELRRIAAAKGLSRLPG